MAAKFGARWTIHASCLIGGALFAVILPKIRKKIRPIYVKMGIISEVATGMQSAAELTLPPEE